MRKKLVNKSIIKEIEKLEGRKVQKIWIKELRDIFKLDKINESYLRYSKTFMIVNNIKVCPVFTDLTDESESDILFKVQYAYVKFEDDNNYDYSKQLNLINNVIKSSEIKRPQFIIKHSDTVTDKFSIYEYNMKSIRNELNNKKEKSKYPIIEFNDNLEDYKVFNVLNTLYDHGYRYSSMGIDCLIKIGDYYDLYLSKRILDEYNNLPEYKKRYYFDMYYLGDELNKDLTLVKKKAIFLAQILIVDNIVRKSDFKELRNRKFNNKEIESIKTLYSYARIIIINNNELEYKNFE